MKILKINNTIQQNWSYFMQIIWKKSHFHVFWSDETESNSIWRYLENYDFDQVSAETPASASQNTCKMIV